MSERQGPSGEGPWSSDAARADLRIIPGSHAAYPTGAPDYTPPPLMVRALVEALVETLGIPQGRIHLAPSGDIVEVSDEAGKPTLLIVALRGGR